MPDRTFFRIDRAQMFGRLDQEVTHGFGIEIRFGVEKEGDDAADLRSRHRRARIVLVGASGRGGQNIDARRRDTRRRATTGILENSVRAIARRDRDDIFVGGRVGGLCRPALVADGGDEDHASA
jgi:hypothetical protein